MADPKGKIECIKKRLITHIEDAMNHIGVVTGEWETMKSYIAAGHLPIVTVRVDPVNINDMVFGRLIKSDTLGSTATYNFSAHIIASACNETNESSYRYANQHADDIIDYLNGKRNNATERSTYGIEDISDMIPRESPIDVRNCRRVIVEGQILVSRPDADV